MVVFVLLRRKWHRQKGGDQPDGATTSTETFKLFRRRSHMRNNIPEFVIPGTQLRLVQPLITPPSPPPTATSPPPPEPEDAGHTIRFEKEDSPKTSRRRGTAAYSSLDTKRKISLQLTTRQIAGDKRGAQRSSSLDLIFTSPSSTPPLEPRQVHAVSPLTVESTSETRKSLSRSSSVGSIDLLAINVPPAPRSGTSSIEDSLESSRQSPEDSPRLMRLFRQSKHQIKLTGATVEFSLQYQLSKRELILNVMRVRNVFIPVDRRYIKTLLLLYCMIAGVGRIYQ